MQTVTQSWLVLQLTNSPFLLGLTSTLQFGPILLFGFTFMVWKFLVRALEESGRKVHIPNGILVHSDGCLQNAMTEIGIELGGGRVFAHPDWETAFTRAMYSAVAP